MMVLVLLHAKFWAGFTGQEGGLEDTGMNNLLIRQDDNSFCQNYKLPLEFQTFLEYMLQNTGLNDHCLTFSN